MTKVVWDVDPREVATVALNRPDVGKSRTTAT